MYKKQIGSRIKALSTGKNLTQLELANDLKIDRTTLSKIETGESSPGPGILVELKRIFSTSIDWILTGEGQGLMESDDKDIDELLTTIRENRIVKHAVLSFFYEYKAVNPKLFKQPGDPGNIIDIGIKGVKNDRFGN